MSASFAGLRPARLGKGGNAVDVAVAGTGGGTVVVVVGGWIARAARTVFGESIPNCCAISTKDCGRRSGFFARQAAIVFSQTSSRISPSASRSLRRSAINGGIFSRIWRSMLPEENGGLLVINSYIVAPKE